MTEHRHSEDLPIAAFPRKQPDPRRFNNGPSAGLRTRRQEAPGLGSYWPSLPIPVLRDSAWWRRSFLLTAAGQLRIRTGFPLSMLSIEQTDSKNLLIAGTSRRQEGR